MSKISYCSLEEAWGSSYNKTNDNNLKENSNSSTTNSSNINNSINNNNLKENNNKIQIRNDEKYNLLYKKSAEDYDNVISNMNTIERHNNNNSEKSIIEYNKYRINSSNQVTQNHIENDHSLQKYMPFSDSIERKYLEDKLKFLENEILKYKHLFEKDEYNDSSDSNTNTYIESFSNQNNSNSNSESKTKTNDIIDIILLIIIGLIIILVMNSIFNIGKAIGVRNK